MRFGLAHRVMTSALAVLGVVTLVTSGRLSSLVSFLICSSLAAALLLPERYRQSSTIKFLGVLIPLAFLALQLARLLIGQSPVPIIVEFTAGLQIVRLATRRGAQHDHQVILLALLQLIVGTVLGSGLAYAFSLIGFLIFTPGALVLSHLRREVEGNYKQGAKDRRGSPVDVPRILRSRRVISGRFLSLTCILAVPIFLLTSVLFVVFPRVGFAWFKVRPVEGSRMVGFSDHVDLGGVGKIRSNPRLVMRVQPLRVTGEPPPRLNFYLRGGSFDRYENGAWEKTISEAHTLRNIAEYGVLGKLPEKDAEPDYKIYLEPIEPKILFLPERTSAYRFISKGKSAKTEPIRTFLGTNGEILYYDEQGKSVGYDVFLLSASQPWQAPLSDEKLEAYLALPESFSPKMARLADQWASEGTIFDSARSIEGHLRAEYIYDLESESGSAKDPLEDFLFHSKRGHCEFYSTAMVLLLRSLGIPARNVTGFVGGSYNRFGDFYGVRQADAHSWVEAYIKDEGWVRFDPTPPGSTESLANGSKLISSIREFMEAAGKSWEQNVVAFDLQKQVKLAQSFQRTFTAAKQKTTQAFSFTPGSWLFLGIVVLVGFFGASIIVLKRRKKKAIIFADGQSLNQQRSRHLYSEVESAMMRLDCRRPLAVPPLKHAQALVLNHQPCAEELLELTERYLQVRFGSASLSEGELEALKKKLQQTLTTQLSA